ncbi:MAG: hypothetical protein SD837_00845 [Candidatus Electrothrix scaldis]|nr:MAG: hypothetical protein SD837_00845 [Candidatus Electrothrix sp. GW3-3]
MKNMLVVYNEESSKDDTSSNDIGECYIWPKAIQGTVPANLFTNEEEIELVELMGKDSLAGIHFIGESFLVKRKYYGGVTINDLNKKLFQLGEHASALEKLLNDNKLVSHLQNKIQSNLNSYEWAARQLDNPNSSCGKSHLLFDLGMIRHISNRVKKQQSRTGRRKGQGKIAERFLVERLYQKCHNVSGKRPTNNPNGMLQQLIAILNRPLDLGGTLPGLVRQVIDERKPKK